MRNENCLGLGRRKPLKICSGPRLADWLTGGTGGRTSAESKEQECVGATVHEQNGGKRHKLALGRVRKGADDENTHTQVT